MTYTPSDYAPNLDDECGGCENGECCGACECCPADVEPETLRWERRTDDYGRSVHHLIGSTDWRTIGVVVRVPCWTKPTEYCPTPYFITTWDRALHSCGEPTYAGHFVSSLKAGKALIEEHAATRNEPKTVCPGCGNSIQGGVA